jgi:hypothetical protein
MRQKLQKELQERREPQSEDKCRYLPPPPQPRSRPSLAAPKKNAQITTCHGSIVPLRPKLQALEGSKGAPKRLHVSKPLRLESLALQDSRRSRPPDLLTVRRGRAATAERHLPFSAAKIPPFTASIHRPAASCRMPLGRHSMSQSSPWRLSSLQVPPTGHSRAIGWGNFRGAL